MKKDVNKKRKNFRKKLKERIDNFNESNEIISKCIYCKKNITKKLLIANKAISIGQNKYRCTRAKCENIAINSFIKKYRKGGNQC